MCIRSRDSEILGGSELTVYVRCLLANLVDYLTSELYLDQKAKVIAL